MDLQALAVQNESLRRRLETSLEAMESATQNNLASSGLDTRTAREGKIGESRPADGSAGLLRPSPTPLLFSSGPFSHQSNDHGNGAAYQPLQPESSSSLGTSAVASFAPVSTTRTNSTSSDNSGTREVFSGNTNGREEGSGISQSSNAPIGTNPPMTPASTNRGGSVFLSSSPSSSATKLLAGKLTSVSQLELGLSTARALQAQIASRDALIASLQLRAAEGERARQELAALRTQASLEQSQYKLKEETLERKIEELSLSLKTTLESEARLKAECALLQRERLNLDANAAQFTVETASRLSLLKAELAERTEQLRAADSREQALELEISRLREAVMAAQQQHEAGLRQAREADIAAQYQRQQLEDALAASKTRLAELEASLKTAQNTAAALETEKSAIHQARTQLQQHNDDLEDTIGRLKVRLEIAEKAAERVPGLESEVARLSHVESKAASLEIALRDTSSSLAKLQEEAENLFNAAETQRSRADKLEAENAALREKLSELMSSYTEQIERNKSLRVQSLHTMQELLGSMVDVTAALEGSSGGLQSSIRALYRIASDATRNQGMLVDGTHSPQAFESKIEATDQPQQTGEKSKFDKLAVEFASKILSLNQLLTTASTQAQAKFASVQTKGRKMDSSKPKELVAFEDDLKLRQEIAGAMDEVLAGLEGQAIELILMTQSRANTTANDIQTAVAKTIPQASESAHHAVDALSQSAFAERDAHRNARQRIESLTAEVERLMSEAGEKERSLVDFKTRLEKEQSTCESLRAEVQEHIARLSRDKVTLFAALSHLRQAQVSVKRAMAYEDGPGPDDSATKDELTGALEFNAPEVNEDVTLESLTSEVEKLRALCNRVEPLIARERLLLQETAMRLEAAQTQTRIAEQRVGESILAAQDEAAGAVMKVREHATQKLTEANQRISQLESELATCEMTISSQSERMQQLEDELASCRLREAELLDKERIDAAETTQIANALHTTRAVALLLTTLYILAARQFSCASTRVQQLKAQKLLLLNENFRLNHALQQVQSIVQLLHQQQQQSPPSSADTDAVAAPLTPTESGAERAPKTLRARVLHVIAGLKFTKLLKDLRKVRRQNLVTAATSAAKASSSRPLIEALDLWRALDVASRGLASGAMKSLALPAHLMESLQSPALVSTLLESFEDTCLSPDPQADVMFSILSLTTNLPFILSTAIKSFESEQNEALCDKISTMMLSSLDAIRWARSNGPASREVAQLTVTLPGEGSGNEAVVALLRRLTAHKLWMLAPRIVKPVCSGLVPQTHQLWEGLDLQAAARTSSLVVFARGYHFVESRRARLGLATSISASTPQRIVDNLAFSVNSLAATALAQARAIQVQEKEFFSLQYLYETAQTTNEELSSQLASARSDLSKLRHELDALQSKLKMTMDEAKTKQAQLNREHELAIQTLQRQLQDCEIALESARNEVKDANATLSQAQSAAEEARLDALSRRAAEDELRSMLKEMQLRAATLEKAVQQENELRTRAERISDDARVENQQLMYEISLLKSSVQAKEQEIEDLRVKIQALDVALQQSNNEIMALHADARSKALALKLSRDTLGDLEREGEVARNIAAQAVQQLENTREAWRQLSKRVEAESILSPSRAAAQGAWNAYHSESHASGTTEDATKPSKSRSSHPSASVDGVSRDPAAGRGTPEHALRLSDLQVIQEDTKRLPGHPPTLPRVRTALESLSLRSSRGASADGKTTEELTKSSRQMTIHLERISKQLEDAQHTQLELEEAKFPAASGVSSRVSSTDTLPSSSVNPTTVSASAKRIDREFDLRTNSSSSVFGSTLSRANAQAMLTLSPNHHMAKTRAETAYHLLAENMSRPLPRSTLDQSVYKPAASGTALPSIDPEDRPSVLRRLQFTDKAAARDDSRVATPNSLREEEDAIARALDSALQTKEWLESGH